MKKIIYKNRYGDKIKFTQISPKIIHMSGYSYPRYGYSNDYNKAYLAYLKDQEGINDDPLFLEEFSEKIYFTDNPEYKYYELIECNENIINMFDPSGGPYITLGINLSGFWGDFIPRVVEKIEFIYNHKRVKFTIK